jgi:hypothetical protein
LNWLSELTVNRGATELFSAILKEHRIHSWYISTSMRTERLSLNRDGPSWWQSPFSRERSWRLVLNRRLWCTLITKGAADVLAPHGGAGAFGVDRDWLIAMAQRRTRLEIVHIELARLLVRLVMLAKFRVFYPWLKLARGPWLQIHELLWWKYMAIELRRYEKTCSDNCNLYGTDYVRW